MQSQKDALLARAIGITERQDYAYCPESHKKGITLDKSPARGFLYLTDWQGAIWPAQVIYGQNLQHKTKKHSPERLLIEKENKSRDSFSSIYSQTSETKLLGFIVD